MTAYRLQAKGLTTGYDGKTVIKDITFTVKPGEIVSLIGPNGAGKSTVLKAIARQLAPMAGAIYLDGASLPDLGAADAARALSILTTERVHADRLTVRDVVSLGR